MTLIPEDILKEYCDKYYQYHDYDGWRLIFYDGHNSYDGVVFYKFEDYFEDIEDKCLREYLMIFPSELDVNEEVIEVLSIKELKTNIREYKLNLVLK